jgi:hypothetical protein
MADHLDAPGLMPPGGDASIDITDVYAFLKPGDADKSILIVNVNPLTLANAFSSNALYDLQVDTNGDATGDIAFRFRFSPLVGGAQTATVRRAEGTMARQKKNNGDVIIANAPVSFGQDAQITDAGPYRFFAGKRSDPFFFDLLGFLNGLQFTGDDFFEDKNVFGIALEVPNTALGSSPAIGVYGRSLIPNAGALIQIERMGRPAINTVFNKGPAKNGFNRTDPADDVAKFFDHFVEVLTALGAANPAGLAGFLLPDILTYDFSSSAGFPNGRNLIDDVIDIELGLVTNGAISGDGAGPHSDLLSDFPFMGDPHT